MNIKNIRKTLLATLLTVFALSATAQEDYLHSGITLSLSEALGTPNLIHSEQIYPSGGEFDHVFCTELTAGYRMVVGDHWSFGLSTGLVMADYTHSHTFDGIPLTTQTGYTGNIFTHQASYTGRTTLNLPILVDAKLHFTGFARQQGIAIVPLLSARAGYIIGLTSIKGDEQHTYHFVSATPPNDRADRYYSHTNMQGLYMSIGVGLSFRQFSLELEYARQPHTSTTKGIHSYKELYTGKPEEVKVDDWERFAMDDEITFTLRLTYNF